MCLPKRIPNTPIQESVVRVWRTLPDPPVPYGLACWREEDRYGVAWVCDAICVSLSSCMFTFWCLFSFLGREEECYWSAHRGNSAVHQTGSSHHNRVQSLGLCVWQRYFRAYHLWLWRSRDDGNGKEKAGAWFLFVRSLDADDCQP